MKKFLFLMLIIAALSGCDSPQTAEKVENSVRFNTERFDVESFTTPSGFPDIIVLKDKKTHKEMVCFKKGYETTLLEVNSTE